MQSTIQRIELYNFKSYTGRTTIGPFRDFSCIVGPNGAGKSNLMDALSFVLSPSTRTQTMRGRSASDFISRKAATRECAVTIVLRRAAATDDGSSSRKKAGAAAETSFTRSVNGAGEVRVAINGQAVPEQKFLDALEQQHGISRRVSTFLVFQHAVDSVARMKPAELTELLESVSGSDELRPAYASSKKALDEANRALTNASLEKRGAVLAVNQMRLAKKEADKFTEVRQQYLDERRDSALTELLAVEVELERQKAELDAFNRNLAELQRGVTTEQALREMKRSYTEQHRRYLEDLKRNRRAAEELRLKATAAERIRATLAHLQRKQGALEGELAAAVRTDGVRSRQVQQLEEQLAKQEQVLAAFERDCVKEDKAAAAAAGAVSDEALVEYRRLRKEADCETVTMRQKAATVRRQRDALEETRRQCAAAREVQRQQRADLEVNTARTEAYLRELEQRQRDLVAARTELESEVAEARRELQVTQRRSKEREAELAKIQEQLHELRFVREDDKRHSRFADALQALRALFPIRGRLVDLCTIPNERHRNAVTAALGRNLDAIVVDTTDTAIACVRYLKEQRMPPMTFLPLDSVTGPAVDDRLRTFGGTCRPVVDVVRFDAALEPAIRYALGQALLCDSMAEAKTVAYGSADGERYKVVTLDGTTLLKNGSVQGGLAAIQSRARKWDEKRYDDLRVARDRLLDDAAGGGEAALARAQIAIRDMEARLAFSKNRSAVVEAEVAATAERLKALAAEAAAIDANGEATGAREAQCDADLMAVNKELLHTAQAIAKAEGKVFAEFKQRVNLPDLQQLEDRQALVARQRAEQRQELELLIHRLRGAVEVEKTRVGGQSAVDLRALRDRLASEVAQCTKNLAGQQGVVATAEKAQEQARAVVAGARQELDQLEAKIRQATRDSEQTLNRLAYARKGSTGLQVACDTLRLRRLNIVRRCQVDETELPLRPAATAGTKRGRATVSAAAAESGTALTSSEPFSLVADSSQDAKEVCVDFSGLTDALRGAAADRAALAAYKARSADRVAALTAEMEALVPTLRAANRFAASEGRLDTSASRLDEAKEQARAAHAAFQAVKEQRTARFMAVYDKVAASVDAVYRELTLGTRAHAVHGSAYLGLEDVEEPYAGGTTYHATPPMKRYMPMELLSGGERTMAALALLFAIHAVSPTPFLVLDEVDAALDAGNVEKLAKYLRKNSSACQCIVVSLKDQLYHMADILIGVTKDRERETSMVLTMDLSGYPF